MKKLFLIGILMLVCLGFVYGAGTFRNPLSSTTKGGSIVVNVTCTLVSTQNASVTFSSALTGDSATVWLYNYTDANKDVNNTFNTKELIDATDYAGSCTCYNSTSSSEACTATTSITIDNTVPVVDTPTPATGTKVTDSRSGRDVAFSVSCANATSATLYIDNVAYTMTESSDTCSYTKDYLGNTQHSWYVIGSDGTNTTTSSTYTYEVRRAGSLEQEYTTVTTSSASGAPLANQAIVVNSGTAPAGGNSKTIFIVILAVLVGYFVMNKRK